MPIVERPSRAKKRRSDAFDLSEKQLEARGSPLFRKKPIAREPDERNVPPLELSDTYLAEVIRKLPGYDPYREAKGYVFDFERARYVINFFHQRLMHVRGDGSGTPFTPTEPQRAWLANMFGWRVAGKPKLPRYRQAFLTEARGEGKTTEAAGVVLCVLTHPETAGTGAEIYSAAYSIPQANLVWSQAKAMATRDPWFAAHVVPYTAAIIHAEDDLTTYKSIAAEAKSAWGFTPRFVVVDELHAQKNRNLVDALKSALSKRADSQILYITTAGDEPVDTNICWEIYSYACKVRDGQVKDARFLPAIYEVPKEADWTDETLWPLAHPNRYEYQVEDLRREAEIAKQNPAQESLFRQVKLNQWVHTGKRWISLETFRASDVKFDPASLAKRKCYGGLDLGENRSLTAFALAFPPVTVGEPFKLLVWHLMPDKDIRRREEQDNAYYRDWARDGHLSLCSGPTVDLNQVRVTIEEAAKLYKIQEIAYDRWGAGELIKHVEEEMGLEVFKHGQGFAGMSGPAKDFERLVLEKRLAYNGSPVLEWQMNHLVIDRDPAGNIKLNKGKSSARIDGMVAGVMAVGRAALATKKSSVYNSRGLIEATW